MAAAARGPARFPPPAAVSQAALGGRRPCRLLLLLFPRPGGAERRLAGTPSRGVRAEAPVWSNGGESPLPRPVPEKRPGPGGE